MACPVLPWERRLWRPAADCPRVLSIPDALPGAAGIWKAALPDAVDRWAASGPAPRLGAFPEGRPGGLGKRRVGPVVREIFEQAVERQLVAERTLLPMRLRDWLPLDVVLDMRPVPLWPELRLAARVRLPEVLLAVLLCPPERLRDVAPQDVLLMEPGQQELRKVVPRSHWMARPPEQRLVPPKFAAEAPQSRALRVEPPPLVPRASRVQPLAPQRGQGAPSSLWPPRSSPLPRLLPPRPAPRSAFGQAPRARYRSNSSASSFP